MKKVLAVWAILCVAASASAQDVQFSQFFSAPMHVSPAFAGSSHHHRFVFAQRLQWPALNAKFITSQFSYDTYLPQYNSGIGGYVIQDFQGSSTFTNTEFHLVYSYELAINGFSALRAGLTMGGIFRSLNYSSLLFPSQFDDNGLQSPTNNYAQNGDNMRFFGDVGSGLMYYNRNFWASFAAFHMNTPNQAFLNNERSVLPMRTSIHMGYKIKLFENNHMAYLEEAKDYSITPVVHYKMQGKSDQFDVGVYGIYDQLMLGMWYRGIPFKRYDGRIQNSESVVFFAGWLFNNLSFGYSYDLTVSSLRNRNSTGAHELNITYVQKHKHKRHKQLKRLPCPDFYHIR